MIIETEVSVDVREVARHALRDPEYMVLMIQEYCRYPTDGAELGRACAEYLSDEERDEYAAWLRAFAGALAPEPEPEPAMSETDTRLRAFLARLDQLDAEDLHDAIVNEVLRTSAIFGHLDAPKNADAARNMVLVLHGITSVGATGDEVIANWANFARASCQPPATEDDGFVTVRPDVPENAS